MAKRCANRRTSGIRIGHPVTSESAGLRVCVKTVVPDRSCWSRLHIFLMNPQCSKQSRDLQERSKQTRTVRGYVFAETAH